MLRIFASICHPDLSPLTRGTLSKSKQSHFRPRFIPADAGNTMLVLSNRKALLVYPRWRGEHTSNRNKCGMIFGLSPLARGTPAPFGDFEGPSRFIPAGAGNTYKMTWKIWVTPVYPRWRGEHTLSVSSSRASAGLSPLTQGTPAQTRTKKQP